jgi:hypothetical protein
MSLNELHNNNTENSTTTTISNDEEKGISVLSSFQGVQFYLHKLVVSLNRIGIA